MKIKIIQRIVPSYRRVFFDKLYNFYGDNFKVYTSFNIGTGPLMAKSKSKFPWLAEIGKVYEVPGICWQTGAFKLKIEKNDVIIIEGSVRIISNFIIILKAYIVGAKLIWWGHYLSASSKPLLAGIRHKFMKKIPYILFYTDHEINRFIKDHERTLNLFSLNNGIDIEKIKKNRKAYSTSDRDIDILFLGRISTKANASILLQALNEEKCLNYTATFLGAQDEHECSKITDEINMLSLTKRVTVVKGSSLEEIVSKYANRAKIFCYPGQVGLSLLHAMGYGLPCIVHNDESKQMPEFCAFEENKTGISFEQNNPGSLALAINTALLSPDLGKMSSSCISVVESKYTLDLMKENFINMINSIK